MSISSRITQIEQHIGNAYDKIEDLGIDLTDVDKNINNISAMLENVWDEYPKVSATDVEEASISGTKKGRINIDLKGNTEQEQLTGKNLFSGDYSQFNSTGGEGTLYDYFKLPENDKVYTISVTAKNDFTPTRSTYLGFTGNGGNASLGIKWVIAGTSTPAITKGTKISINNIDNEKKLTYISMYSKGATNLKTFTDNFDIQLEEGSTATSYEPYCGGIPSPSPDFPQQIKNVTGNNNIEIQNKNLLDLSKCTVKNGTLNSDNSITSNIIDGYYTQINTTSLNNYLLEHKGKSITFSIDKVLNNKSISIVIYGQRESSTYQDVTVSNSKTVTLTIANDFTLIDTLELRVNRSNTKFTDTTTTVSEIMLEQGSTATSYVEHQEQNLPSSLKSKNLFILTAQDFKNGSVIGYAKKTALTGLKPNTTYICSTNDPATIGANTTNLLFGGLTADNNGVNSTRPRTSISDASGTITMGLRLANIDTFYQNYWVQVEEGTTATDYEPYYEYELCKIDTAEDYFYKNSGKWYKKENIEKIILDGLESGWTKGTSVNNNSYYYTNYYDNEIQASSSSIMGISDKFTVIFSTKNITKNNILLSTSWAHLRIYIDENIVNGTAADFKTWLSNNNVELYCIKVTPTDIEITETTLINQLEAIKQAKSYNDQTNISQTNDELPFILDIEALKGENTNEVNLLTSNNRKTTEYLETSLEQEEVEKIEEVEEPKEVEIQEEERVDTEENAEETAEETAENAENSAESEEE